MRHTGGSAFGLISTRSTPASSASSCASLRLTMPITSPSNPLRRTSGTPTMSSLILFAAALRASVFLIFMTYSSNIFRLRSEICSLTLAAKSSIRILPRSTPSLVRTATSLFSIS